MGFRVVVWLLVFLSCFARVVAEESRMMNNAKVKQILNSKSARSIRNSQATTRNYSKMIEESYGLEQEESHQPDPSVSDEPHKVKRRSGTRVAPKGPSADSGKDGKFFFGDHLVTREVLDDYMGGNRYQRYNVVLMPSESALIYQAREAARDGIVLQKFSESYKGSVLNTSVIRGGEFEASGDALFDGSSGAGSTVDEEVFRRKKRLEEMREFFISLNYVIYNSDDDWVVTVNNSLKFYPSSKESGVVRVHGINYPYVLIKIDTRLDEDLRIALEDVLEDKTVPGYGVKVKGGIIYLKMHASECFQLSDLMVKSCRHFATRSTLSTEEPGDSQGSDGASDSSGSVRVQLQ